MGSAGLGSKVLGCRVWGLGTRIGVYGLGFRVQDFGVWGLRFGV